MKFDLDAWVKLQQANKDVIVTLDGVDQRGKAVVAADDTEGWVDQMVPENADLSVWRAKTGPDGLPLVVRHYGTVVIRVIEALGVSVSDDIRSRESMG